MKNLEEYLDEAITNIRDDRAMASNLLVDLVNVLKVDPSKHQYSGQVAAKYLETLQRSNEQLVKITAMLQKREAATSMTELDKEEIYDLIKGE